jgi:hypothetical protein
MLQVPQTGVSGFIYMYVGPALLIFLTGVATYIVNRLAAVHKLVNSTLSFQTNLVSVLTRDNQALRIQMARNGLIPMLEPAVTVPLNPDPPGSSIVQPQVPSSTPPPAV